MSLDDMDSKTLEDIETPQYVILDFKELQKFASEERPFVFLFEVSTATKGQYSGYLLRGKAYLKLKDAKLFDSGELEAIPLEAGVKTPLTFFTKTSLESQWKNEFGDEWPTVIRGHLFVITYQGMGKSNQGRDMHFLYAKLPELPSDIPSDPDEK